jgi:hypothetical protein
MTAYETADLSHSSIPHQKSLAKPAARAAKALFQWGGAALHHDLLRFHSTGTAGADPFFYVFSSTFQ